MQYRCILITGLQCSLNLAQKPGIAIELKYMLAIPLIIKSHFIYLNMKIYMYYSRIELVNLMLLTQNWIIQTILASKIFDISFYFITFFFFSWYQTSAGTQSWPWSNFFNDNWTKRALSFWSQKGKGRLWHSFYVMNIRRVLDKIFSMKQKKQKQRFVFQIHITIIYHNLFIQTFATER